MSASLRRLGRVVLLSERRPARAASWGAELERLLAGRTLGVAFQPILRRQPAGAGDSRWQVCGTEALLRARADRRPALRPDKLLPVIARAGLLHRVFEFVLAESLAAARTWEREAALKLDVSVNVHASALLDDALPHFLLGLLDAVGLAPARLTLELTENAPIADLQRAAANARLLRRSGVRLALDDFGVGFSTATRLAWIECDELKIDRAAVLGMEHCEEQACLVEQLVTLAHGRGMTACAEGVETEAALGMLAALGCDRVQGYYIARPAEAAAVPELARDWHARSAVWRAAEAVQMSLPGLSADADFAAELWPEASRNAGV